MSSFSGWNLVDPMLLEHDKRANSQDPAPQSHGSATLPYYPTPIPYLRGNLEPAYDDKEYTYPEPPSPYQSSQMRQTTTSFDYEPREREFTPQSKRAVPAPGPQPYGAITSQSIPLNSPLTTVFKRELPDTSETKPHEKKHKSARAQKDHEKLAAVNGVVIPSKLDPGTKPTPQQSHADDQSYLSHTCTICKSRFGKTSHVKSHFPACVERFGNPNGARWDDDIRFQRRKRAPLKRTVRDDGESAPEHEGTLLQRPFTVEEREQGIRQRELAVSEREQAVSKREMAVLKREEAVSRDEQLINGWAKPVQEHDDTLYRQYRSGPSFPERGLSQQHPKT